MTESFQATCAEDEVIIMETALYGRMSLGRCVKTDFGFVGCSTDVLDLADSRCSGRRRCRIAVPDPLLENTKPCNQEFKSYLQTSYSCVRGRYTVTGINTEIDELILLIWVRYALTPD